MSKFKSKFFPVFVGLFALSLAACSKKTDDAQRAAGDGHDPSMAHASAEHHAEMHAASGQRVVAIDVGSEGFKPSRIEVKKGQATTLRFTRTSDKTCATKVVFPDIKLEKDLPMNKPVDVAVPTDQSRTLAFQCGMGMFKSSLVVN